MEPQREKTSHTEREHRGGNIGESETSSCLSICSPTCLPTPRDEAFLRGHAPACLSPGGLKAHAGRFPFMYKEPLIPSDERRAATGRGGDTGLGTSCRTGREATGHPSCRRACQAGLWTTPWAQAPDPSSPWLTVHLRLHPAQGRPTTPNLSGCPTRSSPPFPQNGSAARLTKHFPWTGDRTS